MISILSKKKKLGTLGQVSSDLNLVLPGKGDTAGVIQALYYSYLLGTPLYERSSVMWFSPRDQFPTYFPPTSGNNDGVQLHGPPA